MDCDESFNFRQRTGTMKTNGTMKTVIESQENDKSGFELNAFETLNEETDAVVVAEEAKLNQDYLDEKIQIVSNLITQISQSHIDDSSLQEDIAEQVQDSPEKSKGLTEFISEEEKEHGSPVTFYIDSVRSMAKDQNLHSERM